MIFQQVYLLVVILAMVLRMIFNYLDPNPFGSIGRFSYWLRKKTNSLESPIAAWLSSGGFSRKFVPFVSILVACLVGYFALRFVWAVTFTLDGVIASVSTGRIVALIGYLLFGTLALLSLAIFARIILSWFGIYGNAFSRFLARITDPILVPFRRLIPPVGFLDISPMIVLFLLDLFQRAIVGTLIS